MATTHATHDNDSPRVTGQSRARAGGSRALAPAAKAALALLLAACAFAAPAMATGIYRCKDGNGVENLAGNRAGNDRCVRMEERTGARRRGAPAVISGRMAHAAPRPARVLPTASAPPRTIAGAFDAGGGVPILGANAPSARAKHVIFETCFACRAQPGLDFGSLRLNTTAYAGDIRLASSAHGIDEAVVRAVIHAESAFDPNALSRAGAQGLMQLMPATARRFGVRNPLDAAQNIEGGVRYLAWLLERFDGDLALAAAGYNAGEGAIARYGGVPPYAETRRYDVRVKLLAQRYREARH